jgi:thiosulfate/3-mercaptopyruvate sulfurtransferase
MLNKSRLLPAVLAATLAISVPVVTSAAAAAAAAPAANNPIVKPADLKALLGQADVRVLDIRAPKDYATGHIPGAVNTPYGAYRGPADNAGALQPESKLTEMLRQAGITVNTRVIVAHQGLDHADFGAAARVYWTLKVGGLTRLSILDGGTLAWKASGGALETGTPKVAATGFTYHYDKAMIEETQQLANEIRAGKAPVLVDARPAAFFKGEQRVDAAARYGTLPGARSLDNGSFFGADDKTLKPASELLQAVRAAGAADKPVVAFCNTGHLASTDWFVLSEIVGNKNAKLYPESMVEWSKTKLPMQNEPSRMTALVQDAKRSIKK